MFICIEAAMALAQQVDSAGLLTGPVESGFEELGEWHVQLQHVGALASTPDRDWV